MKLAKLFPSFILCIYFFFSSGRVFAISLEDCKALAVHNSDLLAAYQNLIQSSIYSWHRDKSSLFGQVTAFYQPDNIQFSDRSDLRRTHGWETRVGSAYSLDLQKILTDYPALSRLDIKKSQLLQSMARSELLKNVTQNYYRLYVLLKKKKEYQDVLALFQGHINEIKELQSRGLDVAFDLARLQVQFQTSNVSFKNIDNEIKDLLNSLNAMMNTAYSQGDFSVMDTPDMRVADALPSSYLDLQQSQLDKIDVDTAGTSLKQSKLYYLPTIQLGLEHNVNTVDPNVEEYRSFLSLNFDIFDFGTKANEEKRLKYNYEYQKNLFQDNQKKLKLKIQQMMTDAGNARNVYEVTMENLKNAKASIEVAKQYYRQGKIKEIDLLSTFSDYLTATDQTYEALYNFLAQKAQLNAWLEGPAP